MSRCLAEKNWYTILKRWMDLPLMLLIAIYWFSSVPLTLFSGDLRLAYLSDLLFGCKDSENYSFYKEDSPIFRVFYEHLIDCIGNIQIYLALPLIFCTFGFAENRLHLGNIQINLVFHSICTIFAGKLEI